MQWLAGRPEIRAFGGYIRHFFMRVQWLAGRPEIRAFGGYIRRIVSHTHGGTATMYICLCIILVSFILSVSFPRYISHLMSEASEQQHDFVV